MDDERKLCSKSLVTQIINSPFASCACVNPNGSCCCTKNSRQTHAFCVSDLYTQSIDIPWWWKTKLLLFCSCVSCVATERSMRQQVADWNGFFLHCQPKTNEIISNSNDERATQADKERIQIVDGESQQHKAMNANININEFTCYWITFLAEYFVV